MFFVFRFSWLPECFHPGILFLSNCTSRGQERHGKSPANEDTYHRRWYQTWPVWRTCSDVITCCSGSASTSISYFLQSMLENGTGLSREPYLRHFCYYCSSGTIARLSMHAFISTGTIARLFQQEPSLDFPCSVHRSKIPVRLPQSAIFLISYDIVDIQSERSFQIPTWELSISC